MLRYKWYVIIFLILLVIAQPNLAQWFAVKGIVISFVLFFIMLVSFEKKRPDIFIVPVAIGFLYDMLYSPWLGRMAIVLLIAALSVIAVGKIVYRDNMPVLTLFFFVTTYLLENIRTILEVGPGVYFNSFGFIQGEILWISIYAAALAAVFGTFFYFKGFIRDRRLRARKRSTT